MMLVTLLHTMPRGGYASRGDRDSIRSDSCHGVKACHACGDVMPQKRGSQPGPGGSMVRLDLDLWQGSGFKGQSYTMMFAASDWRSSRMVKMKW